MITLFPIPHFRMKTKRPSTAKKEFRVIAETSRRVYQDVLAAGPKEAYEIASDNSDAWDSDTDVEDGDYRLWESVFDVEANELVPVPGLPVSPCETCGSEIADYWAFGMPL